MHSSTSTQFEDRPILVLALGGNALSPPAQESVDYTVERTIIAQTGRVLERLISGGYRLLVVHGNGPQVGRLLRTDPETGNLDIHIAQTQGELGYLLTAACAAPMVCVLTRVIVEDTSGPPVKPIGPILTTRPNRGAAVRVGDAWRVVVPSPKPMWVVENDPIASLLRMHHVVAGGGGGVPMTELGIPVDGVVDKDWIASLLAVSLDAEHIVFATDVDYVYAAYGELNALPCETLTVDEARQMVESGCVTTGSMAPKVESAIEFVTSTGRSAHICGLTHIEEALVDSSGTTIRPG